MFKGLCSTKCFRKENVREQREREKGKNEKGKQNFRNVYRQTHDKRTEKKTIKITRERTPTRRNQTGFFFTQNADKRNKKVRTEKKVTRYVVFQRKDNS